MGVNSDKIYGQTYQRQGTQSSISKKDSQKSQITGQKTRTGHCSGWK